MSAPFVPVELKPLTEADKAILVQMDIHRHLSPERNINDVLHLAHIGSDYHTYWYIGHNRIAGCEMEQVLRLLRHSLIVEVAHTSPALGSYGGSGDGPFFILTGEGRRVAERIMSAAPLKEELHEEDGG